MSPQNEPMAHLTRAITIASQHLLDNTGILLRTSQAFSYNMAILITILWNGHRCDCFVDESGT